MVLQVTLQDAQRETAVLARRLGLAARDNEELAMSATETQQPSLAGKVGHRLELETKANRSFANISQSRRGAFSMIMNHRMVFFKL